MKSRLGFFGVYLFPRLPVPPSPPPPASASSHLCFAASGTWEVKSNRLFCLHLLLYIYHTGVCAYIYIYILSFQQNSVLCNDLCSSVLPFIIPRLCVPTAINSGLFKSFFYHQGTHLVPSSQGHSSLKVHSTLSRLLTSLSELHFMRQCFYLRDSLSPMTNFSIKCIRGGEVPHEDIVQAKGKQNGVGALAAHPC